MVVLWTCRIQRIKKIHTFCCSSGCRAVCQSDPGYGDEESGSLGQRTWIRERGSHPIPSSIGFEHYIDPGCYSHSAQWLSSTEKEKGLRDKFQLTNSKFQINPNDRNSKFDPLFMSPLLRGTVGGYLDIGAWKLDIICNLVLGA